ncbi:6-phosphogluconolactonase [Corynebacterium sp. TAE3-ERU12]|uniref:6-phosphogluconolactonase n=1 Tax=Corynebacterium sp. TAE3-ERU12 TaxID=2849491 RepID=UPI001C489E05|nr:6-phosphogluconolactonase [Corynebacterium sp. TAE3-ERU12]MBV7295413.1 6-phosphogluconolactonase [Corynebacterium sp. TAE3-ERU12]
MSITVSRHDDQDGLIEAARARFVAQVSAAQRDGGIARVVLTGGGAGIGLLRALRADYGDIDFSRVLVFFGDERFVPADDAERNELQARQALLDHIDIPAQNIFPIAASDGQFGADPEAAAAAYARVLAEHAPDGFDIHLLGMGPEGHINSLFPHTEHLAATGTVVAVRDCPKPPPTRVSLTWPAIATAKHVWLLVAGSAKAEAAAAAASGANPQQWPAAGARGSEETVLFVAADASGWLDD